MLGLKVAGFWSCGLVDPSAPAEPLKNQSTAPLGVLLGFQRGIKGTAVFLHPAWAGSCCYKWSKYHPGLYGNLWQALSAVTGLTGFLGL